MRTGLPPTKERYCSMVSFGGVDTGKSNIQREREERREEKRREEKERFFTIKLKVKKWRGKNGEDYELRTRIRIGIGWNSSSRDSTDH